MAPRVGFEPTTQRLTAVCSTTELPRNISFWKRKPAYIIEKARNVKKNFKKRYLSPKFKGETALHMPLNNICYFGDLLIINAWKAILIHNILCLWKQLFLYPGLYDPFLS